MGDLREIEEKLWALLQPYRAELVDATIYGMASLRWPGAKAHDYFAAIKPARRHVSLFLVAADSYPDALVGTPPALLKRRTGKAAFNFGDLDDDMARDVAALLARLYERYRADHVTPAQEGVSRD